MGNQLNGKRELFAREGFSVFEDILDSHTVDGLRHFSDEVLVQQSSEHFAQQCTTGSMVLIDWAMVCQYPILAELIAAPRALGALRTLGFDEPKSGREAGRAGVA